MKEMDGTPSMKWRGGHAAHLNKIISPNINW